MPKDLEFEIAEMLDEDFPTPVDEVGEEGSESGGDSVTTEGETEPTTSLEGEVEGEGEKKEEVPPEEPAAEGTPKGGEPVVGEEVKKEGEGEVTPPVVEPPVAEPVSELDGLKAQVSTLMGLLNTAHSGAQTPQVPIEAAPADPADFGTFMEGVNFDSVMESKESFMEFFTKSMDIMRQQAEKSVMEAVPGYVSGQVQRSATMRDVATEFYSTYPELSPVKGYVANVASEISAGNPTWDMNQVLTETAKVTKNTLGLTGQVVATPVTPGVTKPNPVLPGGTRTTKAPSAKKSGLQSDIDDFLND
jgi:hypothetical protein